MQELDPRQVTNEIRSLIDQKARLVRVQTKLEAPDRFTLTLEEAVIFARVFVDIIQRHVADPETVKAITDDIREHVPSLD